MAVSLKPRRGAKFWSSLALVILLVFGGGVLALRSWYNHNLSPVSSSSQLKYFTVTAGSGVKKIAQDLKRQDLIRSAQAFETYVRSHELHDQLQAGTYSLSPSMSVQQIVDKMIDGQVTRNLLTILPGKRLDQIKKAFRASGYSQAEVDDAFNIRHYLNHPALAGVPASASLEGYLYPDSFQKQSNTPARSIIRESLDEMAKYMTADIVNGLARQGLSPHKGVILASIVYQETGQPSLQRQVAQVFYSRLAQGMILGSDVTAYYAAHLAGQEPNLGVNSPYNTRINAGLPPGPISNFTLSALEAVAQPARGDYLYFVYGDDKKMHFSRTQAEHDAAVSRYCQKGCS